MAIGSVSAGGTIQASWGNSVADQLNDLPAAIQTGQLTGPTDGSGDISVTFPSAFSAAPVVVATRVTSGSTNLNVHISAVSATAVTFRCTLNTTLQTSTPLVIIHWAAFGTLA